MAESIIGLKRPEFPKTEETEDGTTTRIEYIGDTSVIVSALPSISEVWGDYPGLVFYKGQEAGLSFGNYCKTKQ